MLDLAERWDEWADGLSYIEAAAAVRECAADLRDEANRKPDHVASALHFARTYGQIAGDHHKTWVIEQMTAALEGRPADAGKGIAP
jgi:hypothetical protein